MFESTRENPSRRRAAVSAWISLAGPVALVVLALAFPLVVDRHWLALGITVMFWTAFSGSWNVIGGLAGQFSLGHAAFFALGAYTSALLYTHLGLPPVFGLFGGIAVAAISAFLVGWLLFRYKLHGTYFAIGTMSLSEVLRVLTGGLPWFGGNGGIPIPLAQNPGWALLQFQPITYYYAFLGCSLGIMALTAWLLRGRFGFQLAAIRDSEDVAESIGISPERLKLRAFVLSAALAAPVGTLYSQYLMFVDPHTFFGIIIAIQVVLPSVVGGLGTVYGPLVGAILLTGAIELSNQFSLRPGVNMFVYGVALMLFSLLIPTGLWPILRKLAKGGRA